MHLHVDGIPTVGDNLIRVQIISTMRPYGENWKSLTQPYQPKTEVIRLSRKLRDLDKFIFMQFHYVCILN